MKRTPEEFLCLLEPIYPRLARFSLAITRNTEDAKDLTSDTVLAALEQFDTMQTTDRFAGFLFKIASRLHKRKRYRERFRIAYNQTNAEARQDENPSPEQAAELAIVMEALNSLPPKMKETVVLFDVADLSLEEIREIQGGTISGVKSRLKRGREMVRKYLGITAEVKRSSITIEHQPLAPALKGGKYYAL